jgi:dolichyl-phosphate beta-glucosyltransferase
LSAVVSIVIPCFYCHQSFEEDIQYLVSNLNQSGFDFEIILVNDGSPDEERIREVCSMLNITLLSHHSNLGKGAAVKTGMKSARGNVIVFTDMDVPYGFENLKMACDLILSSRVQVVTGDRTLDESDFFNKMPFYRNFGSKMFSVLVKMIVVRGFADTQCGLKAFSNEVAKKISAQLRTNGFAFDVEILKICRINRLSVFKIPVQLRKREMSSVTIFKATRMVLDLFKIAFYYNRKRHEKN